MFPGRARQLCRARFFLLPAESVRFFLVSFGFGGSVGVEAVNDGIVEIAEVLVEGAALLDEFVEVVDADHYGAHFGR